MAIKFNCSKCGADIKIKFLHAGETARCRKCGADNPVPANAREIADDQAEVNLKTAQKLNEENRPANQQSCAACRYFEHGEDAGKCHRYPPANDEYPLVTALDWCGEHDGKI
jgi:uncharacterized paraquat-inducible protein A